MTQLLCATGNYLQAQGRYDLAARSYQAASEHGCVNIETWHLENIAEVNDQLLGRGARASGQRERALEIVAVKRLGQAPRGGSFVNCLICISYAANEPLRWSCCPACRLPCKIATRCAARFAVPA